MKLSKAIRLFKKYTNCPECDNDLIGNGEGGIVVEDGVFKRFCKCGFSVTVNESDAEMECDCEDCKFLMYDSGFHFEYYCDYHKANIEDLDICEHFRV